MVGFARHRLIGQHGDLALLSPAIVEPIASGHCQSPAAIISSNYYFSYTFIIANRLVGLFLVSGKSI